MLDYGRRYLAGGRLRGSRRELLGAFAAGDTLTTGSLPPYMQHALLFPYVGGARFVDAIGTWREANRALRGRHPASTEQVLHPRKYRTGERTDQVRHPRKYRAGERPLPVRLPRPGGAWRRTSAGELGEFDTIELIRTSDSLPRARAAAAGWGGGRYALWQRGPDSALTLAWRWDTRRDAAELAAALPRYIERTLNARPAGPGLWRLPDTTYAAISPGDTTRLTLAPDPPLARRLSEGV
jgi:hypothetical protein